MFSLKIGEIPIPSWTRTTPLYKKVKKILGWGGVLGRTPINGRGYPYRTLPRASRTPHPRLSSGSATGSNVSEFAPGGWVRSLYFLNAAALCGSKKWFCDHFKSPNYDKNKCVTGADPEPPLPGGTSYKWPMKPKASLRREAPKGGGWGRGWPPPAGGGLGGLPRKFFEKLHQNGVFWVHFEVINTLFLHWKFIWKKCVSLNLHIDYLYFFFKILRNLHQNGAFWAYIN